MTAPAGTRSGAVPVLVLVDGSNVARCGAWRTRHADGDDIELRQRLVDALCSWAPVAGVEVHVVFDGAGPWRAGKIRATESVIVIGSGRAEGDDVLERRASNAHRDGRTYWVATSDRALQQVAGARADRVIDADDLVHELVQARASETPSIDEPRRPATSQLGADLDDDTRAKLERLRRGLDAG